MKRFSLCILFLAATALAAPNDERRSIQVSGEGTVKVVPDEVKLQFGIESNNRSLVQAKDDNTARSKKVIDALKKFNVSSKDIQTGFVQISPRYDYVNGRQSFAGYTANKQIAVTLKDIDNYGKILNAVVDAGADHVSGVQFDTSKTDELKKEARKRAIADAKAKAEMLAGELNQKIGPPLFIQEGDVPVAFPNVPGGAMRAMEAKASPEDTLSPGEITIRASVTVRFQLQ